MKPQYEQLPMPLPPVISNFDEFLKAVTKIAEDNGYELRPTGWFGYEKTYWREKYDQKLTPQQAWDKNR